MGFGRVCHRLVGFLTGLLRLAGTVLERPAPLTGCAASAAFLVAVGEAGDRVRRRWAARQDGRTPRQQPPGSAARGPT